MYADEYSDEKLLSILAQRFRTPLQLKEHADREALETIHRVKVATCNAFNITLADLESAPRPNRLAHPRQISMVLCRRLTGAPLRVVGEAHGNRDHGTVIYAQKQIKHLLRQPGIAGKVRQVLQEVNQQKGAAA